MTRIPTATALLLMPLTIAYEFIVNWKNSVYDSGSAKPKRLKGTVISVGNLTTGGTGKTPMVLWLAERFLSKGKSVAILSRGYKGSGGTSDEIELLKRRLQGPGSIRSWSGPVSNGFESGVARTRRCFSAR